VRFRSLGLRAGIATAAVLAVAAAAAGVAAAADPGQTAGDLLQSKLDQIQSSDRHTPGIIGMVRDGGDREYAASGWDDQFMRVPADPEAQFRIGSNTKAFISTVILQLEAEGKLSIDDTVDKWLPGVVSANGNDGTKITIRELLDHTSGLKDYLSSPRVSVQYVADIRPLRRWQPQELVDIATSKKPYAAPGKEFHYSNTNYTLAGMIIQAVTGHSAQSEVENRIIKPLGLTNTTFPVTDPKLYGNWMHGYFDVRDISFSNVTTSNTAGAMVSTLDDLTTFESALLAGKLLPAKQMSELEDVFEVGEGEGYGLGIEKMQTPCGDTVYSHNGAVLGYLSAWFSSPDGSRQVAVAINSYNMTDANALVDTMTAAENVYCSMDS
jgi:D-alanyl-D-alanine carboxypeptidase